MKPQLTFAIPFYRGLDYLREAIASVLAQTRSDWCLLVSDDGCIEPGARAVAQEFGDSRIRYRQNESNLGMVRNWNLCIDQAPTDLVTLLHADDLAMPDYADVVLGLAARHPGAAALFCAARIIDSAGRARFSTADAIKRLFVPGGLFVGARGGDVVVRGEDSLRTIMAGNFIMCPTLCLRKSILGDRRFCDEWKQVQDLELTSRLLMQGDTLVGSRTEAYAYRRHPENATAVQSESLLRFEEELQLFARIADQAEALGWHAVARVSRRATIVRLHLLYRVLLDILGLRTTAALAKLRFLIRGRPVGTR